MSSEALIASRTLGKFNLSIATSLAIEGLCGIHDEIPTPKVPPVLHVDELWINIRTLIRNITGSVDGDVSALSARDIGTCAFDEMLIILNECNTLRPTPLIIRPYACSYNTLSKILPYGLFKEVSTPKQIVYARLENEALEVLDKLSKERLDKEFDKFDVHIRFEPVNNACMFTHYPTDLLFAKGAKHLELLESHTGKLKGPSEWNSKLKKFAGQERMPFDFMTVQVYGDSGGLLSPQPLHIRKRLVELSVKYKWNAMTTRSKITSNIAMEHDLVLQDSVRKLYR